MFGPIIYLGFIFEIGLMWGLTLLFSIWKATNSSCILAIPTDLKHFYHVVNTHTEGERESERSVSIPLILLLQ